MPQALLDGEMQAKRTFSDLLSSIPKLAVLNAQEQVVKADALRQNIHEYIYELLTETAERYKIAQNSIKGYNYLLAYLAEKQGAIELIAAARAGGNLHKAALNTTPRDSANVIETAIIKQAERRTVARALEKEMVETSVKLVDDMAKNCLISALKDVAAEGDLLKNKAGAMGKA